MSLPRRCTLEYGACMPAIDPERRARRSAAVLGALALACATGACMHRPNASAVAEVRTARAQVDARLRQYNDRVLAMDHAAIAALFAPEGEIANPGAPAVHGRAAIDSFLVGFASYHVLENRTLPTATLVHGDSAVQVGTYRQRVRTPQGDTLAVAGAFRAVWRRSASGEWLILRMGTTPAK